MAKWSVGLFIAPIMGSEKMRTDTKLTIGLRRLTPELLLPTDASPVPNLVTTRSVSQPKLHEPQQRQQAHQMQHHTDDFLHSTMKLFLLVTPPAARMQVACPLLALPNNQCIRLLSSSSSEDALNSSRLSFICLFIYFEISSVHDAHLHSIHQLVIRIIKEKGENLTKGNTSN